MSRQAWLMRAIDILRNDFAQIGETIPKEINVMTTWPNEEVPEITNGRITIGRFTADWESPGHYVNLRIYIDPKIDKGLRALDVLVHELVHAVVCAPSGHGDQFQRVANAIGLDDSGPTAFAEEALLERLREIKEILGMYPEEAV